MTFIVKQIISDSFGTLQENMDFLLTIQNAKDFLTIIHEISSIIELFEKTNTEIPAYHIKTKKREKPISQAPLLEELDEDEIEDVCRIIKVHKILEHYESEN